MTPLHDDTICALSTPPGTGALAVIRISGKQTLSVINGLFFPANNRPVAPSDSHKARFGYIRKGNEVIDEVVCTFFRKGHSFTGEDSAEISCHGSPYIQKQLLQLLHEGNIRLARPGEFTQRAFLHGRMDLSQAEAVADLIASETREAHRIALSQLRGGFSDKLRELRQEFIDFAALVELELDFSEEDVEFAERDKLFALIDRIEAEILRLADSFDTGNAIKSGIPVAIVGEPNVGKSTLLNALFQEEKALVSDIAGTTRDSIEDVLVLDGLKFRFIDTAGIRKTADRVEQLGIERTFTKVRSSAMVLYMIDLNVPLHGHRKALEQLHAHLDDQALILVLNKADSHSPHAALKHFEEEKEVVVISAKTEEGLPDLRSKILAHAEERFTLGADVIVSNARHQAELQAALEMIHGVRNGLNDGLSGEFIAMDIRQALEHLGNITGQVSNEEVLGSIFSRFCIGK